MKDKKKLKRITQNSDSKRGKNPKSLANLQPFKSKAETGGQIDPRINVGGRPKLLGESYSAWLAQVNGKGITNAESLAAAMGKAAIKGDVSAAREIRAATEGDKHELSGANGGPIQVEDINETRAKRWQQFAPTLANALREPQPAAPAGPTETQDV